MKKILCTLLVANALFTGLALADNNETGKQDYPTYLPENSLVRKECMEVAKSSDPLEKKDIKKNCMEIREWMEAFSKPQPSVPARWLKWSLAINHFFRIHSLIADVLPSATENEKNNEIGLIYDTTRTIKKEAGLD